MTNVNKAAEGRQVMYNKLYPIIDKRTGARGLDEERLCQVRAAINTFNTASGVALRLEDTDRSKKMKAVIEDFAKVAVCNFLTRKFDAKEKKKVVSWLNSKVEKCTQDLCAKTPIYATLLKALHKIKTTGVFLSAKEKEQHSAAKKAEKDQKLVASQHALIAQLNALPPVQPQTRPCRPRAPSITLPAPIVADETIVVEKQQAEELPVVPGTLVGLEPEELNGNAVVQEELVEEINADAPAVIAQQGEVPAQPTQEQSPVPDKVDIDVVDVDVVDDEKSKVENKKPGFFKSCMNAFLTPFKKIGQFFSWIWHKCFPKKEKEIEKEAIVK
jgi:hypothetical protein